MSLYLLITFGLAVLLAFVAVHLGFRAPRLPHLQEPSDIGLACEPVALPAQRGKKLIGWLIHGSRRLDAPLVVMMHGWGANASVMLPVAVPMLEAGANVLLFDARNHGRSPSDGHSSMPKFAEDVEAALDWLHEKSSLRPEKTVLVGHSVGAAAVLLVASRRRDIDAVISLASFAHPEWLMRRQLGRVRLLRPLAMPLLRYVQWIIGHRFDDIAPIRSIARISCPVLLVHGSADETIPPRCMDEIVRHAPQTGQVEALMIEGAGHASVDMFTAHAVKLLDFLARSGVQMRHDEQQV